MANKSAGPRSFSDEAVRAKTGKGWDEWLAMDAWGMKEQGHRLTAKHLQEAYGVGPGGRRPSPSATSMSAGYARRRLRKRRPKT